MIKKFLGLFAALMITIQAYASVSVAPTKLEINANKARGNYLSTSIDIKGDKSKPTRLKVSAGYFKINENSEADLLDSTGDIYDLSKKIRFIPSEFNVLPGRSQKLRINVVGLNKLPDGESRAMLYIEDVESKEYNIPTGKSGFGAQLIVKTRVGVPVYVDKGNVKKIGEIEYLNVLKEDDGKIYASAKINSKGNSKIRYTGKLQVIQDKKLISEQYLSEHAVGNGNYYILKEEIDTKDLNESGEYTLRIVVSYKDEKDKKKNITKETQFNVGQNNIITNPIESIKTIETQNTDNKDNKENTNEKL